MGDARDFIENEIERPEIDDYWTEVESRSDEIIKPTVGVHQNGEMLFSWNFEDYYFEVLFFDSSIEAFWKDKFSSAHFLPNSTELAARWTIKQFQRAQNT